ncbi:transporter substrate-binding domain-containing protein [Bacillaceae bacterium S4-13-58]
MKKLLTAVLGLALLFALAACGSDEESSADSKGSQFNLVEDGKFTYASSGEYKPFSYMNEDGTMTGFDIKVGEAIAGELGLEPSQQKYKFNAIVEGVKTGRFDAAVASHTITDKRKEHVSFSTPYYYSGAQIFTRPDSDAQSLEDLEGLEVAVSKGSTYADYADEVTDDVVTYDSDITALEALTKEKHDAVITDFLTGKEAIGSGNFDIVGKDMIERSEQAIAVAKDSEELLDAINEALETLRENGTLEKLSKEYFGEDITTKPE